MPKMDSKQGAFPHPTIEVKRPSWSRKYVSHDNVKIQWRDWEMTGEYTCERRFLVAPHDEMETDKNHVHMKDMLRVNQRSWFRMPGYGFDETNANIIFSAAETKGVIQSIERVVCDVKVASKRLVTRRDIIERVNAAGGGEFVLSWRGDTSKFGWGPENPDYEAYLRRPKGPRKRFIVK